MTATDPYAFFRQVIESDLPYFARCMGAGASLRYALWENILNSLQFQFQEQIGGWHSDTWVMVVQDQPIFILENAGQGISLTGPPSWKDDPHQMMLAWQASLVHFFLRLRLPEVSIVVQPNHTGEVIALERLGCLREEPAVDAIDDLLRFKCRPEVFMPVI